MSRKIENKTQVSVTKPLHFSHSIGILDVYDSN